MNPITAIVRLRRRAVTVRLRLRRRAVTVPRRLRRRAVTVPRRLRRVAIVRLRRNPVDGPVQVQSPAALDLAAPDLAVRDPVATTGPVAVRDLAARTDSLTLAV